MMKQKLLFLAVALMMLTACQNSNDETRPAEGEGRITFQVINYQQYSLDDEDTRAAVTDVENLDMAIYDADTKALVKHTHQNKTDNGYGTFSATLPYGTYKAVFLGYMGTRQAIVDNIESVCFPDNFVPHLYSKTIDVVIDNPETEARNVSLARRVAAFQLGSSGLNPTTLSTLTVEAKGGSHHFNALADKGAQVEDRSYTYNVSQKAGQDNLSVTIFTFLTAEESTMNFTATAYDASDGVIRQREFNNVPMKISQRTQYNGYFFEEDKSVAGFTLSLDDGELVNTIYTY